MPSPMHPNSSTFALQLCSAFEEDHLHGVLGMRIQSCAEMICVGLMLIAYILGKSLPMGAPDQVPVSPWCWSPCEDQEQHQSIVLGCFRE